MNSLSGSCRNLAALLEGGGVDLQGGGPLSYASRPLGPTPGSRVSLDNTDNERISRYRQRLDWPTMLCTHRHRIIIVSNQLPIKAKRSGDGSWDFEWDKWGLMKQAGVRFAFRLVMSDHRHRVPGWHLEQHHEGAVRRVPAHRRTPRRGRGRSHAS